MTEVNWKDTLKKIMNTPPEDKYACGNILILADREPALTADELEMYRLEVLHIIKDRRA